MEEIGEPGGIVSHYADDVLKTLGLKDQWVKSPSDRPIIKEELSKEFFNLGIVMWYTTETKRAKATFSFRELRERDDLEELLDNYPMSSWVRELVLDKEYIEELEKIESMIKEKGYVVNTRLTHRSERRPGHREIGIDVTGWKFVDRKI